MGFRFDSRIMNRKLRGLNPNVERHIDAVVDFQTARGAAHMKINAPWTDRTGAARNGLYTENSKQGTTRQILFSHSVAYGIWLEIANSGDYQIIMPSVRVIGRDTMAQLRDLFGDIR